ncbi:MAG TPA: hypothetical protein ACFYEF_01615, partial [Candidatus Wunengus sp. YC63]|uniref:hypothetical protein n=1 Tax=Candidatus Wunengus sp. YC63 TaxID=3367699 RepID=UPI004027F1D2
MLWLFLKLTLMGFRGLCFSCDLTTHILPLYPLRREIKREEKFFPRPWWEGLGEGGIRAKLFLIFFTGIPISNIEQG